MVNASNRGLKPLPKTSGRVRCFRLAGLVARSLAGVEIGHRQPYHEELLIVVGGEAEFRVGDETRHVNSGDFVFAPRDTNTARSSPGSSLCRSSRSSRRASIWQKT